jgi:Fur family peroxide stress response transcriptional regulator
MVLLFDNIHWYSEKMESQQRLTEIIDNLRTKGLRLTPQRLAILKNLVSSDSHPTIEEVYAAVKGDFPMTSLATVYKTITLMKDMQEIQELHFDNQAVRYDGSTRLAHPHLICMECRRICDLEFETWSRLSEKITQESGYQVLNYRMDIFGVCPNCQENI